MEIQGYSNYLIYPDGRVWSKKRPRGKCGKFLSSSDNGNGYLSISLSKNNKRKVFYIHRLIATHYIPNPNNYPCIDHIDRNRQNNNIDNLRWVNYMMNCQNREMSKYNTSGFKNISYVKKDKCWLYSRNYNGERIWKMRKDKLKLICYSFIQELKISLN